MTGNLEAAQPTRTYALIVGAERYAAGKDWDLDGPASDAARMGGWLLDRGVPAENILLFLSPLPENQEVPPAPLRAGVQPATHDEIHRALTATLTRREGDLLWIFWAGHGVMTVQESRRLFYADATVATKSNLDLNSLLASLRTDYMAGFPRQVCVVDACQNHFEGLQSATSLPSETFPVGMPLAWQEQFVLLAAKPGELATNLSAQKAGLFSQALMNELRQEPTDRWPPDVGRVSERLLERFVGLRREGQAKQTPTSFFYRTWEGDERRYSTASKAGGASSPVRRRLAPKELGMLADDLLALNSIVDVNTRLFLLQELRAEIWSSIPYSAISRIHVMNIIKTCLNYRGGIEELIEVVRIAEGSAVDPFEESVARVMSSA
jgi:hypothetical protein